MSQGIEFALFLIITSIMMLCHSLEDFNKNCYPDSIKNKLVRYKNNSKFLVSDDGEPVSLSVNTIISQESYCKSFGLEMPSSTHYLDWQSIQRIFREYVEYVQSKNPLEATANKWGKLLFNGSEAFIFYVGDYEPVDGEGWKTASGEDNPYILWQTTSHIDPHVNRENYVAINMERNINGGPWYMVAADWVNNSPVGTGYKNFKYCQYPRYSKCFNDSAEEKGYQKRKENKILKLGDTHNNLWFITDGPMNFQDAEEACKAKGKGFQLWKYDNPTFTNGEDQLEILKRHLINFFIKQDINPHSPCHANVGRYPGFVYVNKYWYISAVNVGHYSKGRTPAHGICHRYWDC